MGTIRLKAWTYNAYLVKSFPMFIIEQKGKVLWSKTALLIIGRGTWEFFL